MSCSAAHTLKGNLFSVLSLLYDRIDFALTLSADVFLAKMPGIAPPSMTPFAALLRNLTMDAKSPSLHSSW